jgi:hypothetical protein
MRMTSNHNKLEQPQNGVIVLNSIAQSMNHLDALPRTISEGGKLRNAVCTVPFFSETTTTHPAATERTLPLNTSV